MGLLRRHHSLLGLALAAAGFLGAPALGADVPMQRPIWAYAAPAEPPKPGAPPVQWDNATKLSLEGSSRQYTMAEIHSTATAQAKGVADWYPDEHPTMPAVVDRGDAKRNLRPCALCHLPNGVGRPENGPVGGLPRAYIVEQLKDMRSGRRVSAEPRKANVELMIGFAKAMTDAEIDEAARYFSALPRRTTVRVIETNTVPLTRLGGEIYLPLTGDKAGAEPIGARLIETSVDPHRTEDLRDPHGVFTAYAPVGSIKLGQAVVTTGAGGKTPPCMTCHGPKLTGMGQIPGIAGRSPSYLARQINDFRRHARRGAGAQPMTLVAAKLTDTDILEAAAYLASLSPGTGRAAR